MSKAVNLGTLADDISVSNGSISVNNLSLGSSINFDTIANNSISTSKVSGIKDVEPGEHTYYSCDFNGESGYSTYFQISSSNNWTKFWGGFVANRKGIIRFCFTGYTNSSGQSAYYIYKIAKSTGETILQGRWDENRVGTIVGVNDWQNFELDVPIDVDDELELYLSPSDVNGNILNGDGVQNFYIRNIYIKSNIKTISSPYIPTKKLSYYRFTGETEPVVLSAEPYETFDVTGQTLVCTTNTFQTIWNNGWDWAENNPITTPQLRLPSGAKSIWANVTFGFYTGSRGSNWFVFRRLGWDGSSASLDFGKNGSNGADVNMNAGYFVGNQYGSKTSGSLFVPWYNTTLNYSSRAGTTRWLQLRSEYREITLYSFRIDLYACYNREHSDDAWAFSN